MTAGQPNGGLRCELLGRPGSGKTTILASIEGGVRTVTLECPAASGRMGRISERVVLALRYPVWAMWIYGAAIGARSGRMHALRNSLSVQRRVAGLDRINGKERYIIDEGVVHGLFVMLYDSRPDLIARFCARKIIKRLVAKHALEWICVDVGVEECVRRFKKRISPTSRFNNTTPVAAIEAFQSSGVYDELVSLLVRDFPRRIQFVTDKEGLARAISG